MKKIISALLVLMMILAMAAPALAEAPATTTGSITINKAVVGQKYTIYKIFDAVDEGKNIYKAAAAWKTFLTTNAAATKYVSVDDGDYVFWVGSKTDSDVQAFAQAALAYAKENSIENQGSKDATDVEVKFEGIDLGYYLVDSSLGALCILNTTKPNATIEEKNGVPTNEKTVEEDSTGKYGKTNDADFNQTIKFKSTITAQAGAQNYVFHDKMSAGLTYTEVTGITLTESGATTATTVDASNYTVKTSDSVSETDEADKCTFEVVFSQSFCDTLGAGDKIEISYTAKLNENAVVGGDGNNNESWLKYGENGETTHDKTKTYTWDMDLLKYAKGDNDPKTPLSDAQFVLLNNDKTKVATVASGKLTGWADVPTANTDGTITWPDAAILTTDADGKIEIDGLDSDANNYWLREIKAPLGYNKLTEDQSITIKEESKNTDHTQCLNHIEIENKSGTVLPSTGGIGTTIFYVVGGLMVLVAVVLLVTKKKMSSDSGKD